jgi:hypothetical protein
MFTPQTEKRVLDELEKRPPSPGMGVYLCKLKMEHGSYELLMEAGNIKSVFKAITENIEEKSPLVSMAIVCVRPAP